MANKCKKCELAISRTKKGINCAHCADLYHFSCGQIADHIVKDIETGTVDWRCSICRSKRKSVINIGTERRNSTSVEPENDSISSNISQLATEMKSLRLMQQNALSAMDTMSKQLMDLEAMHAKVNQNESRIKILENDNKKLKTIVKSMVIRLDNSEQRACANKIQINNIPMTANLCANDVLLDVSKKINMNMSMDEIIDTSMLHRYSKPMSQHSSNNDPAGASNVQENSSTIGKNETVSIMVQFKSLSIKKDFLNKYRKNKNIFFDNQNKFKIYINEMLSYSRRRLFQTAKLFSKENKYDYVWISNGNIFIRKHEGQKAIRIDASTDFTRIGGLHDGEY